MRVVFFGTPALAVPSLAETARRHEVAAVVCQPDKPAGRGRRSVSPPVKQWAEEHGLPVHQPAKLNDGRFEAWLREQAPDICAIAAYGRLLKQPILDVPPHGFINVHPSLLPRHRGPSPIQTALLEGDEVTGVTIMRLILAMDAGDIILQEETPVDPHDMAGTLSERLASLGGRLLGEALDQIEAGAATFTPQDDSKATYTTMFTKDAGRIRWAQGARAIHNQVRACHPWPVAFCRLDGETCRIHRTEPREASAGDLPPGTVTAVEKHAILVAAGEGALAIRQLQLPGKKALHTGDFLRGRPMKPGDRFEDG